MQRKAQLRICALHCNDKLQVPEPFGILSRRANKMPASKIHCQIEERDLNIQTVLEHWGDVRLLQNVDCRDSLSNGPGSSRCATNAELEIHCKRGYLNV